MEGLVRGDVVVVPFPFSDLTGAKRRPALVVAVLPGDDAILCQITSQPVRDSSALPLSNQDFETGELPKPSNVRPNRLFTADRALILSTAGHVHRSCLQKIIAAIVRVIEG